MDIFSKDKMPELPKDILDKITDIVGLKGIIINSTDMEPYLKESRGIFIGSSPAIIRPKSTNEVAAVVKICNQHKVAIVPQGGNTGLCGGGIASGEIIINLERLNKVRDIDPYNYTMTVDAGCILAELQKTAEENNRYFPLSLGAEGSCQIGGNLATNAGGTSVLRYGNTRELTLGLEVVLPNGKIWDGLKALRKDNTGYNLKQIFIGSEGTLGIITGAVMKLFPLPLERQTSFVALKNLETVIELLSKARFASADTISTFELIPRIGLDLSLKHIPGTIDPMIDKHEYYALIEFESGSMNSGLKLIMEHFLSEAIEEELLVDAVICQSVSQREQMWFIREGMVLAQSLEGASIKNDISVPISKVPEFIHRANTLLSNNYPGIRPVAFGHIGDGNIHYNLQQPIGTDNEKFLSSWHDITEMVIKIVNDLKGSFSAEHGIGMFKVSELLEYKSSVEIELMRNIKKSFDPIGIMNPGKIL
jgi:D-lactate dehydrogenase (cytochrome)